MKGEIFDNSTNPSVTIIEVEGPGALFIAQLKDGIGTWVINERNFRPIRIIKFVEGKLIQTHWQFSLSNGIRAIFYEDNLPLEYVSQMSFDGKLENKNSPLSMVSIPLALETPLERRDIEYYRQIASFEAKLKTKVKQYEKPENQVEALNKIAFPG